jgi:hypothetical protein
VKKVKSEKRTEKAEMQSGLQASTATEKKNHNNKKEN